MGRFDDEEDESVIRVALAELGPEGTIVHDEAPDSQLDDEPDQDGVELEEEPE